MAIPFTEAMLGLSSILAAQAGPEQPTSKWRVDYGETQCAAMRMYGPRTLVIRSAPNEESYEILLLEPGSTGKYASQSDGSVSFGGDPIGSTVLVYSDRGSKTKFFKFRLGGTEMQLARQSSRLFLRAKRGEQLPGQGESRLPVAPSGGSADFAIPQAAAMLDELKKCSADLRKYWNDGVEPQVVATPAQGDIRSLFSGFDYPSEALFREQEGSTRAILLIDEKGKVVSCYNSEPSGIASVDAVSCQVIKDRARFSPARDSRGKAVKSIYYSPRITFQMG
jgi:hypothetical protein